MPTVPMQKKKVEDRTELEQKQHFHDFNDLLNELGAKKRFQRSNGEKYSDSWLKNPQARQTLTTTLKN
jgi:hypothetical protein